MSGPIRNVLFLCTGNSARSILAEALLNHLGSDRFKAHSAGSFPRGAVHPAALRLLGNIGLPTQGLRSKSWNEFAATGALRMDFIFTVCDQAAGEVCPVWPGHPVTAHWGLPDPAAVTGPLEAQDAAFSVAYRIIEARVRAFLAIDFQNQTGESLRRRIVEAGTRNE